MTGWYASDQQGCKPLPFSLAPNDVVVHDRRFLDRDTSRQSALNPKGGRETGNGGAGDLRELYITSERQPRKTRVKETRPVPSLHLGTSQPSGYNTFAELVAFPSLEEIGFGLACLTFFTGRCTVVAQKSQLRMCYVLVHDVSVGREKESRARPRLSAFERDRDRTRRWQASH